MIFDNKERTRTDGKKPGEGDFNFYDSAAGTAYQTYRNLVNGWIAELPEDKRLEVIATAKAAACSIKRPWRSLPSMLRSRAKATKSRSIRTAAIQPENLTS